MNVGKGSTRSWQSAICIFALSCLWPYLSFAQPTLDFQNFTQKDGLSSNYVLSILQDHQGFVWIGSENGLNRFNGRDFLSFRFDPEDPETLSDNWIWVIMEDSRHQLWIGTQRGLNLLNRETGKIERVPLRKDGQVVKNPIIHNVYESPSGSVWVVTLSQGLFKLELENDQREQKWCAEHFAYSEPSAKGNTSQGVFNITHATKDKLWIVNLAGIDCVHIPSKKTISYPFSDQDIFFTGDVFSLSSAYDGKGKIYVGFQNELFIFDTTQEKPAIEHIKTFDSVPHSQVIITGDLSFDRPEVLFFPSDKDLALFHIESGSLELIQKEGKVAEHLFSTPIHAAYKDQQGNYWIGTAGGGLYLGQNVENAFTFYQHDPVNPNSISTGQVRSFLEDRNKGLWVGILDQGLDYFIQQENDILKRSKFVVANPGRPNPLASDKVIKIIQGEEGSIWVATNDNGLIKTDATGKTLETYTHQPDDPSSLSGNRIWGLTKDRYGYIWAGTWQDGLNRLDPRSGQVIRFRHDPANPNSLGSDKIRSIFIDRQEILWIGTENGLTRFDSNNEQFTHFQHAHDDSTSLSSNLVWTTYEDRHGSLWIGTNAGLNRYHPSTGQFEHFYEKDGIPDNAIYGILEDDEGLLWVSTKNGLARQIANHEGISFRPLGLEDGLKTTSFLPKAYLNSALSDQLFFGSGEGILVVRPTLLQQDSTQTQLMIHEMRRFKRKATPNVVISDFFVSGHKSTIDLGYQDQSVAFTLSDLNWMNHPTYEYEYQLVGFNRQWMPLEENMQVSFSNLPPGKYTLKARARNLNNISFEETKLLNLRVYPPWWKSWWAYLMYIVAIGLILLLFVRSFLRLQLEKKEAENLKTLDAFKNHLFTNITHEFRTPLTIISGMNEQIKRKPDRWLEEGYDLIRKNTGNLLNLINQILELQKVESGKLKIKMQQGDIVPFIKNIFDQFQAYAQSKKQSMVFIPQVTELNMDYDQEKMLRIVSNLLSNAIKYAPDHGRVVIQISTGTKTEVPADQCLILSVEDNGPGIPQDQLPYIFDRFFQASTDGQAVHTGTGVGLSLTLELVKLLGGNIDVNSQLGQGTTFLVYLPVTQIAKQQTTMDQINVGEAIFGRAGPIKIRNGAAGDDLPLALIVEDNPDIAQYLQICLEGYYQLEVSPDGQTGIDRALELIPDIVISDVMMPQKDGFELCETLKEDIRTSHIPIILLTAKSDVESRILGLKQGADDYLGKPFHEEELLVRMQNLLTVRRQLQERYQHLYTRPLPDLKEESTSKEDEFILKLKATFEARMDDPDFNLNELSTALFLSRSQLGRKVKALTGRSLAVYLRSIRLQKAKQLLLTTKLPIKEIGYEVGFSSPVLFSRSYTVEFGESPTNTREIGQLRK